MKQLTEYDVYEVPTADIYCDEKFNCRGFFTAQSVHDLSESIAKNGLQFPVVVQPDDTSGFTYRLLAGHRRFKAVTLFLKWTTIPASIRNNLDERQAKILNLTENLERKDLNMLEEARALRNLYPDGVPLRQAAKELNRPTRWVHARLRLLTLPEEVQKWAATGLITAVNIEAIFKLGSEAEQIKATKAIVQCKTRRGKTRFLDVDPRYKRSFRARKTKQHIADLIAHLFNVNCTGLASRVLAWVMGQVTDNELERDIRSEPRYEDPGPEYKLPYGNH